MPTTELTRAIAALVAKREASLLHGVLGPRKKYPVPDKANFPVYSFDEHMAGFNLAITFCVTDGSHRTYNTGYRTYLGFCLDHNIDNSILTVPSARVGMELADYRICVIGCFMHHCQVVKGLNPRSISTYVSGVRDMFNRDGRDLEVFSSNKLRAMTKSLRIDWRASHEEIFTVKRLPFTLDMMSVLRNDVLDILRNID